MDHSAQDWITAVELANHMADKTICLATEAAILANALAECWRLLERVADDPTNYYRTEANSLLNRQIGANWKRIQDATGEAK